MDLGVTVMIHDDTDFAQAFAEARDAGFSHGQVTILSPASPPTRCGKSPWRPTPPSSTWTRSGAT